MNGSFTGGLSESALQCIYIKGPKTSTVTDVSLKRKIKVLFMFTVMNSAFITSNSMAKSLRTSLPKLSREIFKRGASAQLSLLVSKQSKHKQPQRRIKRPILKPCRWRKSKTPLGYEVGAFPFKVLKTSSSCYQCGPVPCSCTTRYFEDDCNFNVKNITQIACRAYKTLHEFLV